MELKSKDNYFNQKFLKKYCWRQKRFIKKTHGLKKIDGISFRQKFLLRQ